ncbi:hypothetical protein HPB48_019136 [Haemaphysalis longicornis]|uniref:ABC-2 type transporter transmembrane domain-containing protein n=1 Tax=Haemaphysalis longicornis TaxID=44386 RepID=A0A9J6GZI8_HAELO|nr:hypothetical protein HPB48_019136 [Haemaphysalis longicornis]
MCSCHEGKVLSKDASQLGKFTPPLCTCLCHHPPQYDQAARILAAVFVPTALAFLSSSFVLFPTHERVSKAKLLQLMAGVPGVLFWGVTFLWDFAVFAVCSTAVMIPLLVVNPNGIFTSSPDVPGMSARVLDEEIADTGMGK